MSSLTFAVISDLHIGVKARAKDFRVTDIDKAIDKDYKQTFINFVKKKKIIADYLILPGDITNQATPDEFSLASTIISDIASTLHVPPDKIIFVPGNHDVDWSVMIANPSDKSGFRKKQRYETLRHDEWIFDQILSRAKRHMLDSPAFSIWEFGNLIVIGYNSSWHDEPNADVHHGRVSEECLQELETYLKQLKLPDTRVKLFLVHHHPLLYSDPIPDDPDFSAMTNAGNLLGLLHKYQFDILIHGHKHAPHVKTQSFDSSLPLVILGAGSFSAVLDNRWGGLVNNQFHVINVDGRDADSACIFGNVESWCYLCGRGWEPSVQKHNGIQHRSPFGLYIQPQEIKKTLHAVVSAKLAEKGYVDWEDVIAANPNFAYLPQGRILEAIESISGVLSFRCVGSLPDGGVLKR